MLSGRTSEGVSSGAAWQRLRRTTPLILRCRARDLQGAPVIRSISQRNIGVKTEHTWFACVEGNIACEGTEATSFLRRASGLMAGTPSTFCALLIFSKNDRVFSTRQCVSTHHQMELRWASAALRCFHNAFLANSLKLLSRDCAACCTLTTDGWCIECLCRYHV